MWLRVLIAASAGALAAAQAAHATPFERTPLRACYVSAQPTDRQPVTVDAGGFTPFARVAPRAPESRPRAVPRGLITEGK